MNDATKFTLCRITELSGSLDDMYKRKPTRVYDDRKIIMHRLLREELAVPYMVKHG